MNSATTKNLKVVADFASGKEKLKASYLDLQRERKRPLKEPFPTRNHARLRMNSILRINKFLCNSRDTVTRKVFQVSKLIEQYFLNELEI